MSKNFRLDVQKAVEAEQNIRAEAKTEGKVLSDEDVQEKATGKSK